MQSCAAKNQEGKGARWQPPQEDLIIRANLNDHHLKSIYKKGK
jgi:hypothetical protein